MNKRNVQVLANMHLDTNACEKTLLKLNQKWVFLPPVAYNLIKEVSLVKLDMAALAFHAFGMLSQ